VRGELIHIIDLRLPYELSRAAAKAMAKRGEGGSIATSVR